MDVFWLDTAANVGKGSSNTPLDNADVAIIGAGFTGLATAYYTGLAGARTVVFEEAAIGSGASGRNGGQVLRGWPADAKELVRSYGFEIAQTLWSVSDDAVKRVAQLAGSLDTACDLENPGHLEGSLSAGDRRKLEDELRTLEGLGASGIALWDGAQIEEAVGTHAYPLGLYDPKGMAFHPKKYADGLAAQARAAGARIVEHCRVVGWERRGEGFRLELADGRRCQARRLVVATNGYTPTFARPLSARLIPVDSAQIAVELKSPEMLPPAMPTVSDGGAEYNYFRRGGQRHLLVGGRVPLSEVQRGAFPTLAAQLGVVFPQLQGQCRVTHRWSGRIALSSDGIPHLWNLGPALWTAGGYTGHGAALSSQMGYFLAQLALDQSEDDPRIRTLLEIPWRRFPLGRAARWALPTAFRIMDWRAQRRLQRH